MSLWDVEKRPSGLFYFVSNQMRSTDSGQKRKNVYKEEVIMKEKKERALKRTLAYAGRYKGLTYLSFVLSAATAVTGVMPFVYLWKILKEVIAVHPHYENAVGIVHNGWCSCGRRSAEGASSKGRQVRRNGAHAECT